MDKFIYFLNSNENIDIPGEIYIQVLNDPILTDLLLLEI